MTRAAGWVVDEVHAARPSVLERDREQAAIIEHCRRTAAGRREGGG